ncbi:MAG: four-carbon acid sugar kinase family protein [Alphaproteobacteria bacterium]|nr:four-carbon acid sugar kinase family protein [Alphaproteobacteria bacterium]
MSIVLGAIADDFTGATDLAGTWVKEGVKTVQTVGVPGGGTDIGDAEAVVVALKSRTAAVDEAVSRSLEALHWLRKAGARQVVFKYCSTFDSTGNGNIGPVADALTDALDADFALVCPAFPTNGRTVYRGYLYVGDMLLSESPMKDHPLTPMRDSSLVRLMAAQSRGRVGLVPLQDVSAGVEYIRSRIAALKADGGRYRVHGTVA